MTGALDDLLVVDASTLFAGPMTAMHLGDLGAQVVKVEHPRRPDPARGHGPERDGHNLWYKTLGRNKRSIQLDLSSTGGAEAFRRLAARADVVVENFSPRVVEQFGLDYESLVALKPNVIQVRMPGFGLQGPWRDYVGWAFNFEQMSGMAAVTGHPDAYAAAEREVGDHLH